MTGVPTWATIPALGTSATKNLTGLDTSNLYPPGVLYPAEHLNQFTYWFANNNNVSQAALTNVITELDYVLSSASITPDGGLTNQLMAALNVFLATKLGVSAQAADSAALGGAVADRFVQGTSSYRATTLAVSADLDGIKVAGFYYCNSVVNRPTGANGYLLVEAQGDLYTKQTYTTTGNAIWVRVQDNGTWQPWLRVPTGVVVDQRITTGGTRTEQVVNLQVGETAQIYWMIKGTATGTVTHKAPSTVGTYQMLLLLGSVQAIDIVNTLTPGWATTNGVVVQDTTLHSGAIASGYCYTVFGYCKRIS